MENQFGTVLVFKPGTTKEQAEKILATINEHLDWTPYPVGFDPEYGGPVWYIP